MILDFHVHSNASLDSNIRIRDLVRVLKMRGLDGSALTDHNTMAKVWEAKYEFKKAGLEFVPGMEVTTNSGHVLALFVEEVVKPHRPLEETLDAIRSMGGISIIPHPFDIYRKNVGLDAVGARFDCVEVFNSRNIFRSRNDLVQRYFNNATFVASSDAHCLREIGSSYTKTLGDDVYKALKKGRTEVYCKYSPFNVHIKSVFNRIENFIGTPFNTRRVLSSV